MINQLEMPMYLEEALPELSPDLKQCKKDNPYILMNLLIAFTSKNIEEHNYKVVKRCFKIADKLYSKGNVMVKNAVENVFVYAFSRLLCHDKKETSKTLGLIPGSLYSLYINQMLRTSI